MQEFPAKPQVKLKAPGDPRMQVQFDPLIYRATGRDLPEERLFQQVGKHPSCDRVEAGQSLTRHESAQLAANKRDANGGTQAALKIALDVFQHGQESAADDRGVKAQERSVFQRLQT